MDDLFLNAKSKRRPIDDDTKSESGFVDGNEVFLINVALSVLRKMKITIFYRVLRFSLLLY